MNTRSAPPAVTDADGGNAKKVVRVHTVLIRGDSRILLHKRSANLTLAPGRWSTVAGDLEPEEKVTGGALRGLREETGVEVDPEDLCFLRLMQCSKDQEFGPAFAVFFIAARWKGTPRIMERDTCERLDWFAPDRLPAPIVPYVAHALADVQHSLSERRAVEGVQRFRLGPGVDSSLMGTLEAAPGPARPPIEALPSERHR